MEAQTEPSSPEALPSISVAIPVYAADETPLVTRCVESVLDTTYEAVEVVVLSESPAVTAAVTATFDTTDAVTVEPIHDSDGGLSAARNAAVPATDGDIIAYIDSDATATAGWLRALADAYVENDVVAVGGRAVPVWDTAQPAVLPDEFLWLVGVTHEGHPDDGTIVRNTFGCNISYHRSVVEQLGFNEQLGKQTGYNLQGEEPELGVRMHAAFGSGMYYTADAVVAHRVTAEQTTLRWLSERAYLQGVSKAVIQEETTADGLSTDTGFLLRLVTTTLPAYLCGLVSTPREAAVNLFGVVYFTALVGLGYLIGRLHAVSPRDSA